MSVVKLDDILRQKDRDNDMRLGLVCPRCGRPDTDTGRDDDLYCEECFNAIFNLED